jgi:hypothetical protein
MLLVLVVLLLLLLLLLPSNLLEATEGERSSLALLFTTNSNFLGKKM